MASIDRADPAIMGHLLAQHRELHDLLVEARGVFERPSGPLARAHAAAQLGTLRQHLARHFAQEERGGFMEESLCRMPRLAEAARGVLADLDGLLERLAARDSGGEAWRQAGHDFEAFASRLLAHERNENAVVQEGYNEDLGFGD
jgi:hypothetical protein